MNKAGHNNTITINATAAYNPNALDDNETLATIVSKHKHTEETTLGTSSNKRKTSTLKNPKKLNWCGSVHSTESEPSHSLLIWSWYKDGFKQATIFVTFGLALSPVLYKVIISSLLE